MPAHPELAPALPAFLRAVALLPVVPLGGVPLAVLTEGAGDARGMQALGRSVSETHSGPSWAPGGRVATLARYSQQRRARMRSSGPDRQCPGPGIGAPLPQCRRARAAAGLRGFSRHLDSRGPHIRVHGVTGGL